jgi:membrane-associated protein
MEFGFLMDVFSEYGYLALFLSFYICLLGLPVPNEVLIMTGGLMASSLDLNPILAFFIIYGAVILNATILFFLGRVGGSRLLLKLVKYKKFKVKVDKASRVMDRYGSLASAIGYFLPVMRHFVPFLMGSHRVSYPSYIRYSYPAAFLWSLALFLVGSFFESRIDEIGQHIYSIGIAILSILVILIVLTLFIKHFGKSNRNVFSKKSI